MGLLSAHDLCSQLDQGNMHLSGLITILDSIPTMTEDQAAVMGDGVEVYCPDYKDHSAMMRPTHSGCSRPVTETAQRRFVMKYRGLR
jgi:hypothetical protein